MEMETLDPNSSSNKRLKTETLTSDSSISPSFRNGKAPIIDDDGYHSPVNLPLQNCGICFSEEGKSVRGLIDSCDHYFCFLCIIEWSKTESRCPLCRARFATIRRMRKDGSFIGEGSVRVPVRDQIYDPFGEPIDPYAQTKCTVCNGTTDESLLLLCDLCDSAWHTYCVGLGATVPEGDWFCRDCALLQAETRDSEMDDNVDSSTISELVDGTLTSASISIFDIVREPKEQESGIDRLLKLVSPQQKFSSTAIAPDLENVSYARSLPGKRGHLNPTVDESESSARTLRNCRNVHRHINVLRENWDSFRTGSLNFSSDLSAASGKRSQKMKGVAVCPERSSKSQSFPSMDSLHSKGHETSSDATPNKQSYNVDKAWKLMNIAKSSEQAHNKKVASKSAGNKAHGLKADNVASKCVTLGRNNLMSPGLGLQNPTEVSGRRSQRSGKHPFSSTVSESRSISSSKYQSLYESKLYSSRGPRENIQSSGKLEIRLSTFFDDAAPCSTSSCGTIPGTSGVNSANLHGNQVGNANICSSIKAEEQISVQADICHGRGGLPSQENQGRGLSKNSNEYNGYACLTFPNGPVLSSSTASRDNLRAKEISACPVKDEAKITSKVSEDEAKGEIQSLVKLNLKLLSKDKRLGADAFKEIARLSTHTILAACGFEHKRIVRFLPKLVCCHGDQIQHLQRSALIPSSCRECFYVFVKDVVNSAMSEKLNIAGVS